MLLATVGAENDPCPELIEGTSTYKPAGRERRKDIIAAGFRLQVGPQIG
jgi:hypothetical protein